MRSRHQAFLLILCCVLAAFSAPADSTVKDSLLQPGTRAPSFSLITFDGTRTALYEVCGDTLLKPYSNKIRHTVIISFWATYCAPCQKEIPELQKFMAAHTTDSVKAFCISIDKEGSAIVEPFVKKMGYTIPILLDQYKKVAARYGVSHLPALFVVDTHGIIRYSSSGYDGKTGLKDKLENILHSIKNPPVIDEPHPGKNPVQPAPRPEK